MDLYAVVSDIHGNLDACRMVLDDIRRRGIRKVIQLGDLIDYGMNSNEVIKLIQRETDLIDVVRIWGNHEKAVINEDYQGFSSQRGVDSAKYTRSVLTDESMAYLMKGWEQSGKQEFSIAGKRCLAVHGSLDNPYWKAIGPDQIRGSYEAYDYVFSGHSHYSHLFTKFYAADCPQMRNKKAVVFINPGSVGQPRNHNPMAQYAVFDADGGSVEFCCIPYDMKATMDTYHGQVDGFYRDRLQYGV